MATNRAMLKEAIADAKAVKETAIANAKAALEEAFTPQLKSMLSLKLQEMEEEVDEAYVDVDPKGPTAHGNIEEEDKDMMEVDLEELLAELNEEEDEMEEGLYEAEEEGEEETEEEAEEEGEPLDLEDMTDEDLKTMIEDVIKDMIESGELEAGEGEEEEKGEEEEVEDEEVDLAELLREIEEMEEMDDMYEEKEEVDEILGMFKKPGAGGSSFVKDFMEENKAEIEKIRTANDKDAAKALVIKWLNYSKAQKMDPNAARSDTSVLRSALGLGELGGGSKSTVSIAEVEEELTEAYSTIESLKSELNEINLLNAKLLYSNKIFKSKNLNESQKVKVLSSFDKANTVGEVKLVFETLSEGIKAPKNTIKENLGSASKSTVTPTVKKPIVESNDAFLRMQKLAGLI